MKFSIIFASIASLFATGCAQFTLTGEGGKKAVAENTSKIIDKVEVERPGAKIPSVSEFDTPYVSFKKVRAQKVAGEVTLNASNAPFGALVSELGSRSAYNVVFGDNVDVNRKVSATFNKATSDEAIKELAYQAGYVAVIDSDKNTVFVTEIATYTFKLPAQLVQTMNTSYSVGGNPVTQSKGGGPSLTAQFQVTGSDKMSPDKLIAQITEMAGSKGLVSFTDAGVLTVKSNGINLRRIHNYLRSYVQEAMRQIDIEATIIEVTLNNDYRLGIQWNKVLADAGGSGVSKTFNSFGQVNGGNLNLLRTSASSQTIVDALAKATDIEVVSQPRITAQNGIPASFFSGLSRPFLGTVQSNVSTGGAGGTTTSTGGSLEYVVDGVSLSVIPSVLDDKNVSLTMLPVLTTVEALEEFKLGANGDTLKGPRVSDRHAFNKVTVEAGRTLILGGLRFSSNSKTTTALSDTGAARQNKELVFLIRTNIQKTPSYEPLISEAI